jgi:hypothetical protein
LLQGCPATTLKEGKEKGRGVRHKQQELAERAAEAFSRNHIDPRALSKNWLTLYHFTDPANLPSIRERGLVPAPLRAHPGHEHRKAVWFTLRPNNPSDYECTAMLTVQIYKFDPLLHRDIDPELLRIEDWRLYYGTIPPDKIEFPCAPCLLGQPEGEYVIDPRGTDPTIIIKWPGAS